MGHVGNREEVPRTVHSSWHVRSYGPRAHYIWGERLAQRAGREVEPREEATACPAAPAVGVGVERTETSVGSPSAPVGDICAEAYLLSEFARTQNSR